MQAFSVGFFGWGEGLRIGGWAGGNFPSRNSSWWKKISMKGAQDLLALFKEKNNEKINMKSFISAGSKEQH